MYGNVLILATVMASKVGDCLCGVIFSRGKMVRQEVAMLFEAHPNQKPQRR